MFKRFILILIVAVTWQTSWATLASYCLHEQGSGSHHFGHHEHEHKADDGKAKVKKVASAKNATSHGDCATCNHHGSMGLGCPQRPPAVVNARLSHCEATEDILSSEHRSLLERPKWHADSQFGADHLSLHSALAAKRS